MHDFISCQFAHTLAQDHNIMSNFTTIEVHMNLMHSSLGIATVTSGFLWVSTLL